MMRISTQTFFFIRKTIFWTSIAILTISLFAATIGQWLPLEFSSQNLQSGFYGWMFLYVPLAIVLTLAGTLKKGNTTAENLGVVISTVIVLAISVYVLVTMMFSLGFIVWTNEAILYRNREHVSHTINMQLADQGALGYGSRRIVLIKPFTPLFNNVTEVDTKKLNKSEWEYVNEEGDLKFP